MIGSFSLHREAWASRQLQWIVTGVAAGGRLVSNEGHEGKQTQRKWEGAWDSVQLKRG